MRKRVTVLAAAVSAMVVLAVLAACGPKSATPAGDGTTSASPSASTSTSPGDPSQTPTRSKASAPTPKGGGVPVADEEHAVPPPGPRPPEDFLLTRDILVFSQETLDDDTVARIKALHRVQAVEPLSIGQVTAGEQVLDVAAVNPGSYRRWNVEGSANLTAEWQRVAGGEMSILPRLGKKLEDEDGYVQLGNADDSPRVHIGAYAPQVPTIDIVVNDKWGEELHIPEHNALLVSTYQSAPTEVWDSIQRIVGKQVSVTRLDRAARIGIDPEAVQTAIYAGPIKSAIGSFSYRVLADPMIAPDPGWVSSHIVKAQVPILGTVTCNKYIIPQLRAALEEIVMNGLTDEVRQDEYAGCYYPRFIRGTTTLSNHAFGTALDLNTSTNRWGTHGDMDPRVVAVFQHWGFAWGGNWSYPDPMHFEAVEIKDPK